MTLRQTVGSTLKAVGLHGVAKSIHGELTGRAAAERAARRNCAEFYRQFVKPGDLVFDVGANLGNRTGPLLHLGANVVAVEPQPLCIEALRRQFGTNPRFTLEACALGPEPGEAKMRVADSHVVSTLSDEMIKRTRESGRFSNISWSREITVPLRRFDDLIARHGVPKFTKIDVEGYEAQVLAGLSRPIPLVSLEFMNEIMNVTEQCAAKLASLGEYRWNYSLGESLTFARAEWAPFDRLLEELRERGRADSDLWGDVYARLA
jgi:FkbM family methyltransferase